MAMLNLETFRDMENWSVQNGGEEGVQEALAHNRFNTVAMMQLAERWLQNESAKRSAVATKAAIDAAVLAAENAERSARYTMWGTCVSAAALFVAALTYLFK